MAWLFQEVAVIFSLGISWSCLQSPVLYLFPNAWTPSCPTQVNTPREDYFFKSYFFWDRCVNVSRRVHPEKIPIQIMVHPTEATSLLSPWLDVWLSSVGPQVCAMEKEPPFSCSNPDCTCTLHCTYDMGNEGVIHSICLTPLKTVFINLYADIVNLLDTEDRIMTHRKLPCLSNKF